MTKKILFQDTSYRDGFQSVFGARAFTKDFLPALEAARDAGITHFEAGGGARFQSLFLYCGESAFDMMDQFRATVGPDARLQTLARGINVVALSQQPKDMIDLHAKMFKKHGMTRIRNFDALNDVNNLIYSGQCIKNAGLEHEVVVTMMELPPGCEGAHDAAFYIKTLKEILDADIPFDSVCFKDASGTSNPAKVYETFKAARKLLGNDVELRMHTHDTVGTGIAQYKAAIEGGCDGVCLARAPLSGGTSQPDLIAMWHALKGTEYTLDVDMKKIMEANQVAKECFKDYFFPPEALAISPEVVFSPMPGGALTANTMMMRDNGVLDKYPAVIEAMSECVAKGGFGTSVTPVSQFYFQQAFNNVMFGPWEKFADGYGKMVLGYFGKTPVPPDADLVKLASEKMGLEPFTGDPIANLEPGIPKAKKILEENKLPVTDENIFIVGALQTANGNKGLDFLKGDFTTNVRKIEKEAPKAAAPAKAAAKAAPAAGPANYTVAVNGVSYDVVVQEGTGEISNIKPSAPKAAPAAVPAAGEVEVKANLPGNVLRLSVEVGDSVAENETLLVLEAMKMETEVKAPSAGTVASIEVSQGEVVQAGQILVTLA
jgi:pyruvate carboxylase subunit B